MYKDLSVMLLPPSVTGCLVNVFCWASGFGMKVPSEWGLKGLPFTGSGNCVIAATGPNITSLDIGGRQSKSMRMPFK